MTTAFIDALEEQPWPSLEELMARLERHLRWRGFSQTPQLSASQRLDPTRPFALTDAIAPNRNSVRWARSLVLRA